MRRSGENDGRGQEVHILREYFDSAQFYIKKAFFSIWENVLLPVWVFLKGVLSFIGSCIHNTLIFISDTVNSVLHLDYYIVLFWDWFCDTFQVIYYFVKPYVTWFLFDFIGKGLRIFSEANYEFAGYYIPPSDDSFIWWFKTYVFILLPCFMLYVYFKQDWFFTWNRQSPLTKFEKFAKMEFTRIHVLVLFFLAHGLLNRYLLTHEGHWDEYHKHVYINNHYGEEVYEKWAAQQIKDEVFDLNMAQAGFHALGLQSYMERLQKEIYVDGTHLNANDRVEFEYIWRDIKPPKNPDDYVFNGAGIIYDDPSRFGFWDYRNHESRQAYLESVRMVQDSLQNQLYRNFGGKYAHVLHENYIGGIYNGSALYNDPLDHNFLYDTPVAHVILSEQYFLEYCDKNNIPVSYHDYYWSTFLSSCEGTWVSDFGYYVGEAIEAMPVWAYLRNSLWPFPQWFIDLDFREGFDGFFFLVAGSNNWTSNLFLSNSFVKAHDFSRLPPDGTTVNTEDVFNIFV